MPVIQTRRILLQTHHTQTYSTLPSLQLVFMSDDPLSLRSQSLVTKPSIAHLTSQGLKRIYFKLKISMAFFKQLAIEPLRAGLLFL